MRIEVLACLLLLADGTASGSQMDPTGALAAPANPDSQVCVLRLKGAQWLTVNGAPLDIPREREVRLRPGTYHLEWGARMAGRMFPETYTFSDSVLLERGHEYSINVDREHPFGQGYVPYLWIEDVDTGSVVSGSKPGPGWSYPREHERLGVFLRITAGLGTAETSRESVAGGIKVSGDDFGSSIAAGINIRQNFAIHFTWISWSLIEPDLESEFVSGSTTGQIDLNVLGGGVTYYFMPVNVYVSGSIGVGDWKGHVESQGVRYNMETAYGFVLDLSAGKEWWISEGWALGIGGAFGYHNLGDSNVYGRWSGTRWAFLFSGTFN